jgi:formamidopyrimidine-DNA glycosylase
VDTRRHGKYMAVDLDEGGHLVLHFGMTSFLKYFKDMEKDTEHDRVLFSFDNGYHLAFDSTRKLGGVRLVDDFAAFVAEEDLGPDPMAEGFGKEDFREIVASGRGMVKTRFMDQSKLAGIGNVYADEILFQAGVHPQRQVSSLSEADVDRLFQAMHKVVETAVEHKADPDAMPDDFLLPLRGQQDPACPGCGGPIEKTHVSSRPTYYCPTCQPEP